MTRTITPASEPAFQFGGPIKQEQLWFFGAYAPIDDDDRSHGHLPQQSATTDTFASKETRRRTRQRHLAGGRQPCACASRTGQSRARRNGLLPALNGTRTRSATNYAGARNSRTYDHIGNLDWVATSSKIFVSVEGQLPVDDQHDSNVRAAPIHLDDDHQRFEAPRCAGRPGSADRLHQHARPTSRRRRISRPASARPG